MSYGKFTKLYGGNGSSSSSGGGGTTVTTINYNLTGITDIDLTGQSGELIINVLSSNAAETLLSFSNHTAVTKVTLRPAAGLTLRVDDGAASLKLYVPTLDVLGTKFGFLELTKRGTAFRETNYIDEYN